MQLLGRILLGRAIAGRIKEAGTVKRVRWIPPQLQQGLRQLRVWNEAKKVPQSCWVWRERTKS